MEFICRFHDGTELARIRDLLRSKGIPTFEKSVESRRLGAQWALFVCLNDQAEDARRIIRDPTHEPSLSVDAEEFERALESPDQSLLIKWSTIMAVAVIVGFAGLVYVVLRLG
jgi:hypothetical protein